INEAFPSIDLRPNDVTMIHRGIVPAVKAKRKVTLEGHEQVRDHAKDTTGYDGLISVVGAKYTTARVVAARVSDRLLTKLQRPAVACRTATTPLPGGDITDVPATIADARRGCHINLPSDTIPHLVAAYGSRYKEILTLCVGRPELTRRLAEGSAVIGAELVWAAQHEMAMTLGDAVIR